MCYDYLMDKVFHLPNVYPKLQAHIKQEKHSIKINHLYILF